MTGAALLTKKKDWDKMSIKERKISRCENCWKRGHWGAECPKLPQGKAGESKPVTKQARNNIVLNLGNGSVELSNNWVLDSGATEHMGSDKHWFSYLRLYSKPKHTSVGS